MTTYYVDRGSYRASDGNAGTSLLNPLQSLARANVLAAMGDEILVKAGVYRESVTLRTNGVSWRALEPEVIVRGTRQVSGSWTNTGVGTYSIPYTPPPSVSPFIVQVESKLLIPSLSAPVSGALDPGKFWYDSGTLWINSGLGAPSTIEVGERACFILTGRLGCTIEGLEFAGSNSYGIRIQGGGDHVVNFCKTSYAASGGIRVEPPSPQLFQPTDAGAGSLAAGTYGYVVTAMFGTAETLPSFERTLTIGGLRSINMQWSNVSGATGYRIYGRTSGSARLMFTGLIADFPIVSGFPSFTDDGTIAPSSTPYPVTAGVEVSPCLVESNEVFINNSHGVYLYGASGCTVRGNYCHHNGLHGIGMLNGANDNLVELNVCHSNARVTSRAANGIMCDSFGAGTPGSSRNVIQKNVCFRNEDSGISIYNGSGDCIVRRNVCFGNGDHGIDNFDSPRCIMTNNDAIGNVTAGLNSEGNSQGVRMFNNISVDNGVSSPRTTSNYRIDSTVQADAKVDYNLSYLTVPPGPSDAEFIWGSGEYSSLAAFRAAHPDQMVHGISADPLFVDRQNSDYRLFPSSPARVIASAAAQGYVPETLDGELGGRVAGAYS